MPHPVIQHGRFCSAHQAGRGRRYDEKRRQILQKGAKRITPSLHIFNRTFTRLSPFRASLLACSYVAYQDLFNWSPEYDRGGAEYEKAATIYKNYQQWDKAIYAYEKCAEANGKASLPTKVAMYIPRFPQ